MPDQEVIETVAPEVEPETETTEISAVTEAALAESEDKKPGGMQRKIHKLTREKYERDGRIQQLEEQLSAIDKANAGKTPAQLAQAEADDPKPTLDKFNGSYDEYIEALGAWSARQQHKKLTAEDRAKQAKSDQEERDRETLNTYRTRVTAFMAEHDDFDDVVGTIKISADVMPGVQSALLKNENGPDLAYYLGQHPEVCAKLSDMEPENALVALGRISAQLFPDAEPEDKDDSPPTTTVKSAPAPIRPVRKVSPTATGLSDDLPYKEWLARREAQIRKRNG